MSLPSYQTNDRTLTLLQSNWATILNPIVDLPLVKGFVLPNVSLTSGANTINHLLGRNLQGWFITRIRAAATIYDTQDTNPTPDLTLKLVSSANVTVDIYVF